VLRRDPRDAELLRHAVAVRARHQRGMDLIVRLQVSQDRRGDHAGLDARRVEHHGRPRRVEGDVHVSHRWRAGDQAEQRRDDLAGRGRHWTPPSGLMFWRL
jgi:hypothetical protein